MHKFIYTSILLSILSSCGGLFNESTSEKTKESTLIESNKESITQVESVEESTSEKESESSKAKINFYEPNLENRIVEQTGKKDKTKPYIESDKQEYNSGETIKVKVYNYSNTTDWVGVYEGFNEPGTMDATKWAYASANLSFTTDDLTPNQDYLICLLEDDKYVVLDSFKVHINKVDSKDYKVKDASFICGFDDDGISESLLKITPSVTTNMTYEIYWAKDNKRLDNYTYLARFTKASSKEFSMFLPNGLYMPTNANQIEVAVVNGNSTSLFVDVKGNMKLQESNYRYSFNVFTDIHINPKKSIFATHLNTAIDDMLYYNKDSKALFTIGDHTDDGKDASYTILNSIMDRYTNNCSTPVYYALGNHDFIYDDYTTQINKFYQYTTATSVNYSFTLEGSKVIYLGTDSNVGEGTINDTNVAWLKSELESANSSLPIYIFLHTPLIDTVAGSYEKQGWYGIYADGKKIKELLSDYPNVYMFTGHTHWTLESENELSIGRGLDANYINCSALSYLWNDNDTNEPGSEGFFVDVYDDYIVLKGREFVEQKWAAYGMYCIPITK